MRGGIQFIVIVGLLAGCGSLLKDESNTKKTTTEKCTTEPCPKDPPPDCPVASTNDDGAAKSGADEGAGADSDNTAKTPEALPINAALTDINADAMAPAPAKKVAVSPCSPCGSGNCFPPPPPPPPPPGGCSTLGLQDVAAAPNPGNGGASAVYVPPTSTACMSSTSQPQNVGVEGTSEKLKLSWKVEPGLQDYATASHTCTNLGSGWHLAATAEMDKLFLEPDFRKPQEVDCLTSFWTSPASASGAQCVANTRGFRYDSTTPTNPLPINSDAVLSSQSATEGVSVAHSVLCINGQLLPDVPCGTAVNQLLLNSPLGIVDAATGLTWANISVKNFTDSDGVAAQCAKGASAGWRMPTKGELETAIKNDLFKTAVFAGNDATCPLAWHKPDVTTTNKTCAGLGAGKDGVISFKTDAACAAGASLVVAKPAVGAVLGLCVKDK